MQKTLKIDQIKPNPDNPRIIKDDKFKKLVKSLQEFPEMTQIRRVVVNKDLMILGGNMRWRAAKEAGWTDIPVEIVDLPEDKQREFIIKDNVSGGEWDWDTLANEWSKEQLEDWGVDIENWTNDEVVEDDVPDLDDTIKPESKLGEVYQLGRHRVMCGDSTKIEDVEKLMDGKKADITFHSPPYNVGHNLGYKNDNKYENYKDDNPEYDTLLNETTNNALNYSRYAFVNLQFLANNKRNIINYLMTFRDVFVDILFWKKSQVQPAMANNVLNSQVECIFVFSNHNQSRAIDTGNFRGNLSNFIETNSNSRNENSDIHNAGFPVEFAHHFVINFSKESVIDLFMGTGTTLIACEQTNRNCYGMEIDPKYVDVIRKRYHKFITGSEEGWIEATPVIK